MPLYEYKCSKCEEVTEVLQNLSESPLKDCPRCETKDTLTKNLPTSTGFRLKGRHWYKRTTTFD